MARRPQISRAIVLCPVAPSDLRVFFLLQGNVAQQVGGPPRASRLCSWKYSKQKESASVESERLSRTARQLKKSGVCLKMACYFLHSHGGLMLAHRLVTICVTLVLLGALACSGDSRRRVRPVSTPGAACVEECRRESCPDYRACQQECDNMGTSPTAAACQNRCQIQLNHCENSCDARCAAEQPG